VSRPLPWGRVVAGAVGYTIAGCVVFHFLAHREPYNSGDLILAAFGMIGLNLGIGKSVNDGLDAVTRFVGTLRSGWAKSRTTEHPVPLFPDPFVLHREPAVPESVPEKRKRAKRPPKGSIAHRSSAKGKAKTKAAARVHRKDRA